ncbi:sensor histidine kinase YesM [Alkalibacillus filiformis]|uniref:Sensor histidine kinase YesM n=1 Tax=Alkalibacillus filiformis TaxID=200990 RepID=A0ABU0DXQ9_9BACI|nr:DUF4181 domain-containing protein [Alkalibacillus filiformis]MDQ0353051.1 sensor histidine kinase YesM [Alkalibacillus filiformis]
MALTLLLALQGAIHALLSHIFFHQDHHKLKHTDGIKLMHFTTWTVVTFIFLLYIALGIEGLTIYLVYISIFSITIILGTGAYLEWRYLKQSNAYTLTLSTLAFFVICFYYFL